MAECSESIGRSQASGLGERVSGSAARLRAARRRASGMTRWPPATSVSLLAVATTLPARSAARTGRRLTTPPVATTTRSTSSRVASSTQRLARGPFRAGRQVQAGERVAVRERHDRRPEPARLLRERRPVAAGREGDDPERVRVRGQDLDRLGPDRARGARGARRRAAQARKATTYRVTIGAANRNESTRSSIPPWPGISVPESLAPAARLSIDSARSPAWAASAVSGPSSSAWSGDLAEAPQQDARRRPSSRRRHRPGRHTSSTARCGSGTCSRPNWLADEVGAGVVRPDREEQQQDPAALRAERPRAVRRPGRPGPRGRAGRRRRAG